MMKQYKLQWHLLLIVTIAAILSVGPASLQRYQVAKWKSVYDQAIQAASEANVRARSMQHSEVSDYREASIRDCRSAVELARATYAPQKRLMLFLSLGSLAEELTEKAFDDDVCVDQEANAEAGICYQEIMRLGDEMSSERGRPQEFCFEGCSQATLVSQTKTMYLGYLRLNGREAEADRS